MTQKILFVQGAGEGSHTEDRALAEYLEKALGSEYELRYPKLSGLENIVYDAWNNEARAELERLGEHGIIVAHSLGAAAILKYLSEEQHDTHIAGLFLIATPYKCKDGEWGTDDFAMETTFASTLPDMGAVVMYHSRDDEWVPFSHLALWAEKIPHATVRQLDGQGHSFSNKEFLELVEDIKSIGEPRHDN